MSRGVVSSCLPGSGLLITRCCASHLYSCQRVFRQCIARRARITETVCPFPPRGRWFVTFAWYFVSGGLNVLEEISPLPTKREGGSSPSYCYLSKESKTCDNFRPFQPSGKVVRHLDLVLVGGIQHGLEVVDLIAGEAGGPIPVPLETAAFSEQPHARHVSSHILQAPALPQSHVNLM